MTEFLVEVDKQIYEISELVTKVSCTDKLNDGCSKLEFSYINDNLVIKNGSVVRFKYNDDDTFYGYVFKHGQNNKKEITITAYDQLRYSKAKDTIVVNGDTVKTLVIKMCNYFNLKLGNLSDTGYVLPTSVQDDKTWLDIIYSGITDTLMNKGSKFALRDEFGSVALRNLEDLTLNLILGDESLVYDFDYEKSIDDDFYNQIKLASDNETSGKRDIYIAKDSSSIGSFGLLQYFDVLDKNYNAAKAKARADNLLKLYNRETETLSLKCIGDTRVRAGNSFYTQISDVGLNKRLIVKSVIHEFLPTHTMDIEVMI